MTADETAGATPADNDEPVASAAEPAGGETTTEAASEAPASRTSAATEARRRNAAARREAAAAGESIEPKPDAAPRRGRRKATRRRTAVVDGARKARSMGSKATQKAIAETCRLAGGLVAIADAVDGALIISNADSLAAAWAPVFDRHPKLKVALGGIEAGGIYGAAIVATATVALPILAHHGKLPPTAQAAASVAGVPMPAPSPAPAGDGSIFAAPRRRPDPDPPRREAEHADEPIVSAAPVSGVHAPPKP